MRRRNLLILFGSSFTLLLLASSAEAYRLFGLPWAGATADMRLSTASFPPGSQQLAVTEESMEVWNRLPNCEFLFTYSSQSASSATNHNDSLSGVAFSSRVQGSTLGVTFSSDFGGRRRAADVLFNSRTRWDFSGNPSFSEWDFGSTARHEFGHALGLDHSNLGCRALMGGGCGQNGTVRNITADDAAGARARYSGPSRHTSGGSSGPSGAPDWQVTAVNASASRVTAGGSLDVSYTVANRGTGSAATAPQRYYLLSTNSTISTQDVLLVDAPERQGPFGPNTSFDGTSPVQIPANTAPGTYWIGILVDPQGVSAELVEDNNTRAVQVVVDSPVSGGGQVDWTVGGARLSAATVTQGDSLTLTWESRNTGAATASVVPPVGIYLSTNDTISASDTEITTQPEVSGTFASGTAQPGTQTLQVNLQPGVYWVGLFVDPRGQVAESFEDNNTVALRFEVTAPGSPGSTGTTGSSPPPPPPPSGARPSAGTTGTATPASTPTPPVANAPSKGGGSSGCSLSPDAPAGWPAITILCALFCLLTLFRKEGAESSA